MPTPTRNYRNFFGIGPSAQKLRLIFAHLYLLPWFARHCLDCELPLRPFLNANPQLALGGLPIAQKLSRYGTEPPYLPSLTVDEETSRSAIEAFVTSHSFPLVLKPLFGAHSRGIQKVHSLREVTHESEDEPMVLQPHVEAPKEYGINVTRVGSRLKIYGLTEVPVQNVSSSAPGSSDEHTSERCPLTVAARPREDNSFRDITDAVTLPLQTTCKQAADQIGLRFGRFDVKARSLAALQDGDFSVLEANGSSSLDLTLYDDRYSLWGKIERLRAHWSEFFRQARVGRSDGENSWKLLARLIGFTFFPAKSAGSLSNAADRSAGRDSSKDAPPGRPCSPKEE